MAIIKCCKGCTDRYPACHDSCERYLDEKQANEDAMARYRKENAGRRQLDEMGVKRRIKNFKKSHGGKYGKV